MVEGCLIKRTRRLSVPIHSLNTWLTSCGQLWLPHFNHLYCWRHPLPQITMSWFRRPDLPTKADLFLEDEYFWDNNTNFTRPENTSNYHVTAPLVWCNNPGPDERVNIAFFVSCVTFAVTSCGMLVILRSKELRRMIGGKLSSSKPTGPSSIKNVKKLNFLALIRQPMVILLACFSLVRK